MESAVEVALPAAVSVARLTEEVLGTDGVEVREGRCHTEGARSSGVQKAAAPWCKIPNSELCVDVCHPSSLHSYDVLNDHGLQNMNSHPSIQDLDAKPFLQESCQIRDFNSRHRERSGIALMEASKTKRASHIVNVISPELASSSASCNISEKNQLVEKKSLTSRRGDKRNDKGKHKNRSTFSLKNGLAGFNSAAGGNNFFGIYGLKPEAVNITKYVNEHSLDELLCGSYSCPGVAKERGKKAANANNNLLLSVRKVCSVIQAQKVLQAQSCTEIDNSCMQEDSTDLVTVSSEEGQAAADKRHSCAPNLPSFDKVQKSDKKIKMFDVADSPCYQPKDVLERLALPPPKDLGLLLPDACKTTTAKNNTDRRVGKAVSHRTGLPPFPWSHSSSGHSKLGSDAIKLSTNRTLCQGRWVKVKNSTALQKGSVDLLADFESLTFDQSLVPSINLTSEQKDNEFASVEQVLSTSGACLSSKVPADDYSQMCAAAQTLSDIAACSKQNPCSTVKLLKKPSQTTVKASKLKGIKRSSKLFDAPKSTVRITNPLEVGDNGFPSKKPMLSADATNVCSDHSEPVRNGTIRWSVSSPLSVKSPPRKLFKDSNEGPVNYVINLVKTSYTMKPPRGKERAGNGVEKIRKSSS